MKVRKILVVAVLLAALTPAFTGKARAADAAVIDKPVTDKWALVVGISKFADPSINLRYPAKDAQDFYNYLITKGNFAKDHVRLLLDEKATKENILDQLGDSWLPRAALPDDLVLIFISSHGSSSESDIRGVNYIVAHDTNPSKLFTTGLPMQHLADTIRERVHSDRVLVVLDTCHAGGASSESKGIVRQGNADAASVAQGSGQMVICSSDKNQSSWESKKYANSVFTRSLIEGLEERGSAADVANLFEIVKDKVQQEVVQERGVMQTPVLEASKWSGKQLYIACQPTRPRAGIVDLESMARLAAKPARSTSTVPTAGPVTPTTAAKPDAGPAAVPVVAIASAPKVIVPATTSGVDRIRLVRETPASDFLKYHFRAIALKEFDIAWDDLAPAYKAKFKNDQQAYNRSVSRHRWLSTSPPDADFSASPRSGDLVKVRVKMMRLAGYNATWLYTLRVQDGKWYVEDVGNAP
jgi:hypothetical protein